MLKFLRKHTKWMLVIFGILLMIAFVAPEAINNLGMNPANQAVATVQGRKVTQSDLQRAAIEVQVLDQFSPLLVRGVVGIDPDPEHWYLLSIAAEQAGLVGGPDDGEQWIANLAPQLVQTQYAIQFGAEVAQQILAADMGRDEIERTRQILIESRPLLAQRAGMTLDDFDRTVAKARGIVRLRNIYASANRLSLPRTLLASADRRRTVFADVLIIGQDRFADRVPEPSEAELQAHFERFKNIPAAGSPNASSRPRDAELPFGYLRPQGVKVATLELDANRILASITPDPVEVNKRWRQNRDVFPGEFADERLRVQATLRDELAARVAEEADKVIRAEILRAVRRFEQEGPYYVLPSDWSEQQPDFAEIARAVVEGVEQVLGVRIPLPTVEVIDSDFLSASELRRLPQFSDAEIRIGNQRFPLADFVFEVRELAGQGEFGLQVGVPYLAHPALGARGQSRIYFSVLDTRPEAPPASLDEIREDVRADAIELAAFEALRAEQEDLLSMARTSGFGAVADRFNRRIPAGMSPVEPEEMAMVARSGMMSSNADVLDVRRFRDAVVEASEPIDPRLADDQIPEEQRMLAVALPHRMAVAIVRIRAVYPATAEDFQFAATGDANAARQNEIFDAQAEARDTPFSFDRLAERLDYRAPDGSIIRRQGETLN
ncbi:MAG: hypothetical protein EA378_04325 [Phycisphaerales bacterium]|nr:MAG: hypothetical protein EA378_04325 [Phycisphaerales bacterium]